MTSRTEHRCVHRAVLTIASGSTHSALGYRWPPEEFVKQAVELVLPHPGRSDNEFFQA